MPPPSCSGSLDRRHPSDSYHFLYRLILHPLAYSLWWLSLMQNWHTMVPIYVSLGYPCTSVPCTVRPRPPRIQVWKSSNSSHANTSLASFCTILHASHDDIHAKQSKTVSIVRTGLMRSRSSPSIDSRHPARSHVRVCRQLYRFLPFLLQIAFVYVYSCCRCVFMPMRCQSRTSGMLCKRASKIRLPATHR